MKKFLIIMFAIINTCSASFAFSDISTEYNNKIMPLVGKGVISGYPDNTFRKDDCITRSGFCKMLSIFIDASEKDYNGAVFSDVDDTHWAYKYISILNDMGVVSGISENKFAPDSYITYEQAVKMIISAIGYGKQADILGGYPNGYLALAKELNIFNIKNVEVSNYATRGDIANILLNINDYDKKMFDDLHIDNFKLSRVITSRDKGNIEGVVKAKDTIESLKWAFLDMNDQLISLDNCELNITNTIDLKDYLDKINFSRLGKGKFKFKFFIKTQRDTYKLIDSVILVVGNNDIKKNNIAILNMQYLNMSQSIGGEGGHKGTYAIDLVGINGNIESLYAPFDGTIKKIYSVGNQQNFVWIESDNKVNYADGTYDYVTVMTGHDNDISDLYVGKKIKQGDKYYQEGNSGKSTGNHIHLEAGKGKVTENGWIKNEYDKWQIENHIRPDRVFYITDNTTIINQMDLSFKKVNSIIKLEKQTSH